MKKLFLIFLFIVGCNVPAGNDPKMVVGVFDPNPETDMSHYEIYWWQGNSSDNWNPTMLEYIQDIPHSFVLDSIMSDSFQVVLDYVAFGAKAVDSNNQKSDLGYSRIYSYSEFFAPGPPKNPRIYK